MRRGQLGPRPWGNRGGRGTQAVARTGRGGRPAAVGRGRQAHAQQGAAGQGRGRRPGTRKHRDTAGPPGKPARDPTATHTRGRSRDAWDAGRSWPSPERAPHPGPAAARAGVPSTHFPPSIRPSHPSVRPQQIRLPPTSDPEAQHPGDTLSSEAAQTGPTQHRHRLRLGSEGGHDRRLLLTTAAGLGEPGPTRRRAPHIPPFPLGSHHGGRPRTHGTHTAPPLAGHPAGPSGTLPQLGGGEARAAVGKQAAHSPTAGPAHPSPPFPHGGEGGFCPRAPSSRHSGPTAHTQEGQRLGAPVPQGSLLRSLEKAFSPRAHRPSPDRPSLGPTEAHQELPLLNWAGRGGPAVWVSRCPHRSVCTARSGAEPAPRPPQGLIRQLPRRGEHTQCFSHRLDPPHQRRATHGTHAHHRGRGPEEDTGLRENDTTARPQAPEGQPGALQGHHRGSNEARSHTHAGGARHGSGTALPTAGRAARGAHARKAKQAHLLVSEDQRPPPDTPRRGDGRPKVRAGGHTPTPLPSSPSPKGGQGGKDRRGAPQADREERTRSLGTPVPRPARLRPGPGEHNHTTSIS